MDGPHLFGEHDIVGSLSHIKKACCCWRHWNCMDWEEVCRIIKICKRNAYGIVHPPWVMSYAQLLVSIGYWFDRNLIEILSRI